jgi:hypothetical protein
MPRRSARPQPDRTLGLAGGGRWLLGSDRTSEVC